MQLNESLSKNNISNSNLYTSMSVQNLEKKIEILKDLMEGYEKENNFLEAEEIKQELIQATKAKDRKILKDTKFRHIQEKETLHTYENEEFIELNNEMKEKWEKLNEKFKKMELKLNKEQEEEIEKFQKAHEDRLKLTMKPSNQLIAAEKKKNFYLKKKE